MLERLRHPWPDHRAERTLGAVSFLVASLVVAMVVFVAIRAWPIFAHNGLSWLGSGRDLEAPVRGDAEHDAHPPAAAYHLHAWPIVYGTLITTVPAVVLGAGDLDLLLDLHRRARPDAPAAHRDPRDPAARIGAVGDLRADRHPRAGAVRRQRSGHVGAEGIGAERRPADRRRARLSSVVILTVMITPIMVALICEALVSVPNSWREGAIALGVNPVRAMLAVTLRAARPAIVAATVLATARALGEAIMISMVSGSKLFVPKPVDGVCLPVRAAAHARLGDRRLPRRHRRAGARAPRSTRSRCCCCSPAFVLSISRLSDQAAAAQVPGARMSDVGDVRRRCRPAADAGRGQRSSPVELALGRPSGARCSRGPPASGCA